MTILMSTSYQQGYLAKNIKFLRGELSQSEFGELIGATRGQIASYEGGGANPKTHITDAICKRFNISIDQLFNKDLSTLKKVMSPSALQKAHSSNYTVNESEVGYSHPQKRDGAQYNASQVVQSYEKQNLTIVPLKAFGGFLMGYNNKVYLDTLEKTSFPWVKGECFAFEVDGFSMMPDYPPGSYVVGTPVEKFEYMQKGKVYVFQTVDGLIIKRFVKIDKEHCHIESLNKEYNGTKPIHLKNIKNVYFVEFKINKP